MIKAQWQQLIDDESKQSYFIALQKEIAAQRAAGEVIFPEQSQVLSAFEYADLTDIKVVILGQDPYHGTGNDHQSQAHGLAFSVNHGIKIPPSLRNIYKELSTDIMEFDIPEHGYLADWAKQGVLLLNTVLTVKQGQAHSHAKLGWEDFTSKVIEQINQQSAGCVFILWGAHAQKKGKNIDKNKHFILNGPHPSPLSAYRGFFGCNHFSRTNQWLKGKGQKEINWQVTSRH